MINEYIKKGEKEFHDKMDMGDVYLEKGKHKEAVNQYMNSLRSLGSKL
jgi:predicted negative regulator of RcsB-dependent stress response